MTVATRWGAALCAWESLGTNRDRPQPEPLPENVELVLYKIGHAAE